MTERISYTITRVHDSDIQYTIYKYPYNCTSRLTVTTDVNRDSIHRIGVLCPQSGARRSGVSSDNLYGGWWCILHLRCMVPTMICRFPRVSRIVSALAAHLSAPRLGPLNRRSGVRTLAQGRQLQPHTTKQVPFRRQRSYVVRSVVQRGVEAADGCGEAAWPACLVEPLSWWTEDLASDLVVCLPVVWRDMHGLARGHPGVWPPWPRGV